MVPELTDEAAPGESLFRAFVVISQATELRILAAAVIANEVWFTPRQRRGVHQCDKVFARPIQTLPIFELASPPVSALLALQFRLH